MSEENQQYSQNPEVDSAGWTVKEKDAVLNQLMSLRKDLNDLVLLLYGTKDVPAVTTNENKEDIKDE